MSTIAAAKRTERVTYTFQSSSTDSSTLPSYRRGDSTSDDTVLGTWYPTSSSLAPTNLRTILNGGPSPTLTTSISTFRLTTPLSFATTLTTVSTVATTLRTSTYAAITTTSLVTSTSTTLATSLSTTMATLTSTTVATSTTLAATTSTLPSTTSTLMSTFSKAVPVVAALSVSPKHEALPYPQAFKTEAEIDLINKRQGKNGKDENMESQVQCIFSSLKIKLLIL